MKLRLKFLAVSQSDVSTALRSRAFQMGTLQFSYSSILSFHWQLTCFGFCELVILWLTTLTSYFQGLSMLWHESVIHSLFLSDTLFIFFGYCFFILYSSFELIHLFHLYIVEFWLFFCYWLLRVMLL